MHRFSLDLIDPSQHVSGSFGVDGAGSGGLGQSSKSKTMLPSQHGLPCGEGGNVFSEDNSACSLVVVQLTIMLIEQTNPMNIAICFIKLNSEPPPQHHPAASGSPQSNNLSRHFQQAAEYPLV